MIDSDQIKQWVKEGTITKNQAKKMLDDVLRNSQVQTLQEIKNQKNEVISSADKSDDKSNKLVMILSIIGAILIFIGIAWQIARNWHVIPSFIKVLILVGATCGAFYAGVSLRLKNQEGVGRALIALGALLFILSLFLISQIYHLASSIQHYAWILFIAWTIIIITAYLLESPENLIVSLLTFFVWVFMQYFVSVEKISHRGFNEESIIIVLIAICLSAGALLYGLSALHNSIKHQFAVIYKYWTILYFMIIFYLLSFQSFLSILSGYTFESKAFTVYSIGFVVLCFLGFMVTTQLATSRNAVSFKEILTVVGIIAIIFAVIFATKLGANSMGYCRAKSCYDFNTESDCVTTPNPLICAWKTDSWGSSTQTETRSYCADATCHYDSAQAKCISDTPRLACTQKSNNFNGNINYYCEANTDRNLLHNTCSQYTNQKDNCMNQESCNWNPSYLGLFSGRKGLPTSLWLVWLLSNVIFIGFIVLVIWHGISIGSTGIVNLAIKIFILDIISRYIGFWMDFQGYFAFSLLAILGGLMLIFGAMKIPQWKRRILEQISQPDKQAQEQNKSEV